MSWNFMKQNKKCNAFTLAEVLITLGIIGVVAAMTLPTLITNYQKKQTVVQLKKAYTELSQALYNSQVKNGMIEEWDLNGMDDVTGYFAENMFYPYLKIIKKCDVSNSTDCMADFKTLDGNIYNISSNRQRARAFITNSGYSVLFWLSSTGTSAWVFVDIDGPNRGAAKLGKDVFALAYFKNQNGKKPGMYIYGLNNTEINTREDFINGTNTILNHGLCKKGVSKNYSGVLCAAVIVLDGWEIKDDYPW